MSHYACNGLHRCSHNWYTITSYTTNRRSQEDDDTSQRGTTFNHVLPVSSKDTLHFYRYLHTHVLIADKQFLLLLLLIHVAVQDHAQYLETYEVFHFIIPHGKLLAHYNIDSKYLGITYDKTKAVEISEQQKVLQY